MIVFSFRTLTQSNTELEDRCSKLLGERPSPTGAAGDGEIGAEEKDVSAEDDPVEEGMFRDACFQKVVLISGPHVLILGQIKTFYPVQKNRKGYFLGIFKNYRTTN